MSDRMTRPSTTHKSTVQQRSLLIRIMGLLLLLVPLILLLPNNPVILGICILVAGVVAFLSAFLLGR
jgi:uncharacterized membrane protein HdeD (DUF308 family)